MFSMMIVFCVLYTFLALIFSFKFFHNLQLSQYNNKSYILRTKEFYRKKIIFFSCFYVFFMLFCLIFNIILDKFQLNFAYHIIIFVIFFISFLVFSLKNILKKSKVRIKFTTRLIRIMLIFTFVFFLTSTFICFLEINFFKKFTGLLFYVQILFSPLLILFSNYFDFIFEHFIKKKFIRKASEILELNKDLIKIGITGSYGKTTVKNILKTLLEKEFQVCATPQSYNTTFGNTKTILNDLKDSQIFISEMGAIKKGDIKEIASFIKPDISILTSIGKQHLETFSNLENIKDAKFELVKETKKDGKVFFNGENCESDELFKRCEIDKEKLRLFEGRIRIENLRVSEEGSSFILVIGEKKKEAKTTLLGKRILEDILLAVAVADKLGESIENIVLGIESLKPVPHRLELIKGNGFSIIDDTFNSNPHSALSALETLALFKDRRKIVATPGFVELGKIENEENFKFGKEIAKIADYCVVINENARKYMYDGLVSGGMEKERIYFARNLEEAKKIFEKIIKLGDVLLLENDLPDNYF